MNAGLANYQSRISSYLHLFLRHCSNGTDIHFPVTNMFVDPLPAVNYNLGITENCATGQRCDPGKSSEMKRNVPTQMADERSNCERLPLSRELWA